MRISDWSSDVCSSDLRQQRLGISLHLELGLFNLQRLADIGRHFIKTALTRCLVLGLADHDQLAGADRDRLAVLAILQHFLRERRFLYRVVGGQPITASAREPEIGSAWCRDSG